MGDTTKGSHDVFVGSIDQGTTSTRFLIFNRDGEPVASHQIEFKQIYPQPGYDSTMTFSFFPCPCPLTLNEPPAGTNTIHSRSYRR